MGGGSASCPENNRNHPPGCLPSSPARHFLQHFLGDVKTPMGGEGVFVMLSECITEMGLKVHPGLCRPSSETDHLPLLTPTPSEACLVNPYY